MEIKGFGVNTRTTDGNFQKLEEQLNYLKKAGFEYLEVSADVVDAIGGGKIIPKRVDKLVRLLNRFGFKRTAHIPNGIDLRDSEDREFQLAFFRSSIEFAAIIEAELLVCHFERASEDPSKESLFQEAILKGLEEAGKRKLKLGIENIEIERLSKVLNFVKKVNEKNLVLALDVGHAFLSEQYFGNDFVESIKEASSLVGHLHLSDNFGRFEKMRLENFDLYRVSNYSTRLNLGRGDLNLPPGWGGAIPYKEVIPFLKNYQGIVVLEYHHEKYLDFNQEILEEAKRLFFKV